MGPIRKVDLLGGVVDLAFDGMGTSAPQIKAGKLRPLAVSSATRNPLIPEIPTMSEAGVDGIQVTTWYGIWAIKGTPKPIIDKMYQAIVQAMKEPDVKRVWDMQGADLGGQPPAEFSRFVRAEIEQWGKVVKASGTKIDN